jgi:hypothetical protein
MIVQLFFLLVSISLMLCNVILFQWSATIRQESIEIPLQQSWIMPVHSNGKAALLR